MHIRSALAASLCVAVACVIVPTVPVAAQTTAATPPSGLPAPQPTEASMKEARAMSETLGIPVLVRSAVQNMRNQMINATVQASGKPIDEAAKIVDEVLMPDFDASVPQLTDALLTPWAANFSASDLKALHDFYATPVGVRLLKALPIVQQESGRNVQAWGQRTFQQSAQKHADELRARGLKF